MLLFQNDPGYVKLTQDTLIRNKLQWTYRFKSTFAHGTSIDV